jgi:hypothetical protein
MWFDDLSSSLMTQDNTYSTCECRLPTDCTAPDTEDAITAAMEQEPQRSRHNTAWELGQSQPASPHYFVMINCICNITRWVHICLSMLYMYTMSVTVTSGHGIILMLSTNVGLKSASASQFGWNYCTYCRRPICYLIGWLLNGIVIFWNVFYWGCMKMCL